MQTCLIRSVCKAMNKAPDAIPGFNIFNTVKCSDKMHCFSFTDLTYIK